MRLAIAMLLVVTSTAAAESTQNAALLYWRAFDLMPASDDFGPNPISEAAGAKTFMLDEAVSMAIENVAPALDLVVRATALDECDWGVNADGEDMLSPITHPTSARRLAAFAIVRARLDAASGKHEQAVALLRGAVALARRAAAGSGMLGAPTQLEVERLAANAALEMAPKVPPSMRARLDLLAKDLPPRVTPSEWWDDERRLVRWARKLITNGDSKPFQDYMESIHIVPQGAPALPEGQKLDHSNLPAMLDQLDAEYVTVGKLLGLPDAEFDVQYQKWLAQLKQKVEANRCLLLLPGGADRLFKMDREVVQKLKSLQKLAVTQ